MILASYRIDSDAVTVRLKALAPPLKVNQTCGVGRTCTFKFPLPASGSASSPTFLRASQIEPHCAARTSTLAWTLARRSDYSAVTGGFQTLYRLIPIRAADRPLWPCARCLPWPIISPGELCSRLGARVISAMSGLPNDQLDPLSVNVDAGPSPTPLPCEHVYPARLVEPGAVPVGPAGRASRRSSGRRHLAT